MNHDNPAAFSQACLDFPTEDWCTCEVVGFWNRKPGAPYNHFDLNIGARSFLNDHFGMFAHKPISSNIGQSIPFWFDRVKTESAFIGIFNPNERIWPPRLQRFYQFFLPCHWCSSQSWLDLTTLQTTTSLLSIDLGNTFEKYRWEIHLNQTMVILLVWRCKPPSSR